MDKFVNFVKAVAAFATDWKYRHDFIEKHWNWKSKTIVAVLVIIFAFNQLIKIDYLGVRWATYKGCWGEEWDTGRDTKHGFIFNTCVIDSGKRTDDGAVVWQKVQRDFAVGEFN